MLIRDKHVTEIKITYNDGSVDIAVDTDAEIIINRFMDALYFYEVYSHVYNGPTFTTIPAPKKVIE